jgi:hypothetical protein
MNQIVKIITDLVARKFYGKLTLSFEKGKITLIKKEETIKPELNRATGF